MGLSAGSNLGPYEILSAIGAGGMGEVYRARDTRLGREVAIKVLPEHLTENAEARQRFEREARTVSRLNHPNICTLYDVGHSDGTEFLVMEYLEGETLATRIEKGPFKPDDLLAIAIQVADALGSAHRAGVLHRNLSPGNIMLTRNGVKLLNFGLVKEGEPTDSRASNQTLAAEGADANAMRYVAPELIQGKPADARSDIFAFGAVFYEMATGRPAFGGKSEESVIAAIMEHEPEPISALEPLMPAAADRLMQACLAKNPANRLTSADGLTLLIEWIRDGSWGGVSPAAREKRRRNRERAAWLVAAAAVIVAAALVAATLLRRAKVTPMPSIETAVNLPSGLMLDGQNASIAFSPDGQTLVFAARTADGPQQLWLRATDGSAFHPLAGTDGATYPFWSPDGRWIGFFASQQLKRINLSTGSVFTVCAAASGRGGTWNREGTIVFAPESMGGLYRVAAAGGTPIQVIVPQSASVTARLPHFLPDGQRLLYFSGTRSTNKLNGIYVLDLDRGKSRLLTRADSEGRYLGQKYLAFVRDGNLMVQRFHIRTLQLSGQPLPVAQNVSFNPLRWTGEYAFSSNGLLVYEPSAPVPDAQLTWLSLDGKTLGKVGKPARFAWAAVSPNGREAVAAVSDGRGHFPLWIYDLKQGTRRRFSAPAGSFYDLQWSPNGRQIAYENDKGDVYLKTASGNSPARQILSGEMWLWGLSDWSPDGRLIALEAQSTDSWDIWMLPMTETGMGKPYVFLGTPYNELYGSFSSDGHWISYISDKSGRAELYVAPFPGRGAEQQVSTGGAEYGGWVRGLRELAYITPQDQLMIVKVRKSRTDLQIGKPQLALDGYRFPAAGLSLGHGVSSPEFFSSDGKRILLPIPVDKNRSTTLTLVTNWKVGAARD